MVVMDGVGSLREYTNTARILFAFEYLCGISTLDASALNKNYQTALNKIFHHYNIKIEEKPNKSNLLSKDIFDTVYLEETQTKISQFYKKPNSTLPDKLELLNLVLDLKRYLEKNVRIHHFQDRVYDKY